MSFGFRAFTFKVTERNRYVTSAIELDDAAVDSLKSTLISSWGTREARDCLPGWRSLLKQMPAKGRTGDDRIRSVSTYAKDLFAQVEVHHGKIGAYPNLLDASGGAQNISSAAPAHNLRQDFYYPDEGDTGIIITEVINRHSALTPFLLWSARLEGLSDQSESPLWHRYRTEPIGDAELLEEIIRNASKVEARFTGTQVTAAGRPGPPLKLSVPVQDKNVTDVAKVLLQWLEGKNSQAVSRMLRALNFKPKRVGEANMSFTMPEIRLEGAENATISPHSINDVFTYTISKDARPTKTVWQTATRAKVLSLAASQGISLS